MEHDRGRPGAGQDADDTEGESPGQGGQRLAGHEPGDAAVASDLAGDGPVVEVARDPGGAPHGDEQEEGEAEAGHPEGDVIDGGLVGAGDVLEEGRAVAEGGDGGEDRPDEEEHEPAAVREAGSEHAEERVRAAGTGRVAAVVLMLRGSWWSG